MTPTTCTCVAVRRAAQTLTQLYDAMLAPSGLKVTQLSLLRAAQRLDAPNISLLGAELELDRTTLGRNLAIFQRDGLVALAPGADLRARTVTVTAAGLEALKIAAPLWDAAQARIAAQLGAAQLAQLTALLSAVADVAAEP